MIDAVEAYNPKHMPWNNQRAQAIVAETGLPAFTSSYAHLPGTIGEVWTTFETDIETEHDLLSALRSGAPRTLHRRSGLQHRLRCLAETAHLGYENTWEKVDRVLLSGMEATHPGHVAYGGRFDDSRVY